MKHNYLFNRFLIASFFMLLSTALLAQQLKVTGTVVDADDDTSLPGVTILEKGTTNGTVTDIDGVYSLTVNEGAILVFSYVGYESQEVAAVDGLLNIRLAVKSEMLEEVLIIGYGTQKKTDKTGAVAHVKAEELNGGVITDPIQSMQGKAATGCSIFLYHPGAKNDMAIWRTGL